jgi:hypothetical protein
MSPLALTLDSHGQTNRSVVKRAAGNGVSLDPRVASILARPEVRIDHVVAARSGDWSIFMACWHRAAPDTFVVLIPRSAENYSVIRFDSAAAYLAWWVAELTSTTARTIPNYLPPHLSLPTLLYALHAVDAYRRAALRRASEYGVAGALWISAVDFASTMRAALLSRDTRWLLPAFFSLTPGVISLLREPSDEQLSWLEAAAFLHPRVHPRTGEDGFIFGEAAEAFGEEMSGGLSAAMGFAVSIWSNNRVLPLEQAFVAATNSANHFIRIGSDEDAAAANHQAMTQTHLFMTLHAMLSDALQPAARERAAERASRFDFAARLPHREQPPSPAPRIDTPRVSAAQPQSRWAPPPVRESAPDPVTTASPALQANDAPVARKFCRQCGATLTGSRFCRKCGNDTQSPPKPPRRHASPPPVAAREVTHAASMSQATPVAVGARPPSRAFKRILGIVVPVVSVVATYFVSNLVLGQMLGDQFGDAARQIVPVLISMVAGSIARQIIK